MSPPIRSARETRGRLQWDTFPLILPCYFPFFVLCLAQARRTAGRNPQDKREYFSWANQTNMAYARQEKEMSQPKNLAEAIQMGWEKVTATDLAKIKGGNAALANISSHREGMCYCGPCQNGERTCCFFSDSGCDDCQTLDCYP